MTRGDGGGPASTTEPRRLRPCGVALFGGFLVTHVAVDELEPPQLAAFALVELLFGTALEK